MHLVTSSFLLLVTVLLFCVLIKRKISQNSRYWIEERHNHVLHDCMTLWVSSGCRESDTKRIQKVWSTFQLLIYGGKKLWTDIIRGCSSSSESLPALTPRTGRQLCSCATVRAWRLDSYTSLRPGLSWPLASGATEVLWYCPPTAHSDELRWLCLRVEWTFAIPSLGNCWQHDYCTWSQFCLRIQCLEFSFHFRES